MQRTVGMLFGDKMSHGRILRINAFDQQSEKGAIATTTFEPQLNRPGGHGHLNGLLKGTLLFPGLIRSAPFFKQGRKASLKKGRSEERRVGKECRSRWWPDHQKKKNMRRKVQG